MALYADIKIINLLSVFCISCQGTAGKLQNDHGDSDYTAEWKIGKAFYF